MTSKIESRRIAITGANASCSVSATKLCEGGDGPGQLGKQKLKVTWTCGDERRFCKTWYGGETAIIICDPKGTRSDYIEGPNNRCD